MQEEINQRSIALTTQATKLTGRGLAKVIRVFLRHAKTRKAQAKIHVGKQTVRQLAKQNQGMSSLDMNDVDMKQFERSMKKYGVDYAVMVNKKTTPPTHTIFFKGRDADAITKAMTDFTKKTTRSNEKPSVLALLQQMKALAKESIAKVKKRFAEHSR